jgi:hypothetical protein
MRYDEAGSFGGIPVMKVRLPVAVLVLAATFAGGMVASRLGEREAKAQSAAGAAVYVPPEGLSFRSPDGHLIARLAYDSRGGFFEIYDRHERPSGSLRSGFASEIPARPVGVPLTPTAPLATTTATDTPDLGY